jgi:hypothetical protein
MKHLTAIALAALAAGAAAAPAAAAPVEEPTLEARAILPADASAAAPFPAAPNTEPAPAPGAVQPIGGFSALIDGADPGTFWAMPDMAGDDPHLRRVNEFDVDARAYTGRTWRYRVEDPSYLVSDFSALDGAGRFVSLERDNFQGAAAEHKQGFVVTLPTTAGELAAKRTVVDLLELRDPAGISLPGRPGDFGLGDPFGMPYQTIEAVLPQRGDRLGIVNDTNFGSTGRNAALPDYSDFIVVRVPGLRDG